MSSFLNIDPDKQSVTSDLERIKQRILRGVQRALLTLPYHQDRGTRMHESLDKDTKTAIANTVYSCREYLRKFYPEVTAKVIKVESLEPLNIQFELVFEEDIEQ